MNDTCSRMNKKEIDRFYPRLVAKYGEYCQICQKTLFELNVERLEIHEIKHERPLLIENMRLLCHGCNHLRCLNLESTEGTREETPEMRVRRKVKPIYFEWLTGKMLNNNYHISKNEAIYGGSYYTGKSVQTIKNWLFPLILADDGPYNEWGDEIYLKGKEPRYELDNNNSKFEDAEIMK